MKPEVPVTAGNDIVRAQGYGLRSPFAKATNGKQLVL